MGRAKVQKLPCGPEMLEQDGTALLNGELASLFRSLVGCGVYLSQERMDVSFAIKGLASSMASSIPRPRAWTCNQDYNFEVVA